MAAWWLCGCSGGDSYPVTQGGSHSDRYFGTLVRDPYRWLEDVDAPAVRSWVEAQNAFTNEYFGRVQHRARIRERLGVLWDYKRTYAPFRGGDHYYFYENSGQQDHSVLYRLEDVRHPEARRLFLDPNTFSADGGVSLSDIHFSEKKYAALLLSSSGSDWRTLRIARTDDGAFLAETLEHIKFSEVAWRHDEGFYYTAYRTSGGALFSKMDSPALYYHEIGTPQQDDEEIFASEEAGAPVHYIRATTSQDYRYLFVSASTQTKGNALFVRALRDPQGSWKRMVDDYDDDHRVIDTQGSRFFILTSRGAPNKRLITTTYERPTPAHWVDVIPESNHALSATAGGGQLFAHHMVDVSDSVTVYDRTGRKLCVLTLPGKGSVRGLSGEAGDEYLFYTYQSLSTPPTVYKYRTSTCSSEPFFVPDFPVDTSQFQTKQVFYASKDGTKIPMYIMHKKGLPMDGQHPTYLYGYGGFNISIRPLFRAEHIFWVAHNGVYAQPNLRGGGEYGDEWHQQGIRDKKQRVFDDFMAAADYLIAQDYTSSDRLVIAGSSNGGLLIGACITQRPALYAVALPNVGVLDMLRYHTFTVGSAWAYDYGTADESRESFQNLLSYSPVHNVKNAHYPAVLVTTADHDDRVVPMHSYKFVSALQKHQQAERPVVIRIYTHTGHGTGKTLHRRLEEYADRYAFVFHQLGMSPL